tara:strand:+ start:181 stop:1290 length:1110 start_codon:yes stop_codon:yes gene_type:complete
MSRILRRPMFRGGRVNSYGTGIASGLADGGRVGYQSAGFVTGQQIIDANRNNPFLRNNPINLKSRFIPGQGTGGLDNLIRATMFDTEQFPLVGKESGIADTASLTEFYEAQGDNDGAEGLLVSKDITTLPKINTKAEASEGSIETKEKKEDDPKIEDPDGKKTLEVKTPKINEIDEAEVTMTDLEKALGLDDAKREYASDALAAASKAFFEGRGFEAISDAANVKSKAPEIKRLAALEEFKAKKAKELYDAQTKAKRFAPGNVEKTVEYLMRQGISKDEAIRRATKQAGTIEEAIGKYTGKSGIVMGQGLTLAVGEFFGDRYKSDVKTDGNMTVGEDAELENGVYTDKDNKLVFEVQDKKVVFSRKFGG